MKLYDNFVSEHFDSSLKKTIVQIFEDFKFSLNIITRVNIVRIVFGDSGMLLKAYFFTGSAEQKFKVITGHALAQQERNSQSKNKSVKNLLRHQVLIAK